MQFILSVFKNLLHEDRHNDIVDPALHFKR